MSEHVDFPGPDEQHASPSSEGDFPADFFDDMAEPAPPQAHAEAPVGAGEWPSDDLEPASLDALEEDGEPVAEPALARTPLPPPAEEPPPTAPVFPIALGLIMIGMLVAAIFVSKIPPETKPAAAAAPAPASPTEPAPPAPTEVLAKELGGRLDAFDAQLKAVVAKVEGLPKPPPAPDLSGLQNKIDALDKSVAGFAGLSEKLDKVDDHFAKLDDGLKSVRADVDKLSDDVKTAAVKPAAEKPAAEKPVAEKPVAEKPVVAATTPTTPNTPAPSPPAAEDGASIAKAVELFNTAKYKEADAAFSAITATDPKDARVFYYAALSHALATNEWQGEAVAKAAAKGAELEKTGVTKSADIDTAFASLPNELKPWLTFFRKPKP